MWTPSFPGADRKSHSRVFGVARPCEGDGRERERGRETGSGWSLCGSVSHFQMNQDGEPGCVSSGLLTLSAQTIGRARGDVVLATY